MKKVELHIHLGGAFPIHFLERICEDPDDIVRLRSFLDLLDSDKTIDYHSGFQAFALVAKIVNTDEKIRQGTMELCESLRLEGVDYVENSDLVAHVLLSLKRNSNRELCEKTFELAKIHHGRGVAGIDISDDAMLIGEEVFRICTSFHDLNIPIALHLGECAEETEEQQMRELLAVKPQRIGHGVFLHEKALSWIFERRIPIEMCLSSAVKARMVKSMCEHPALEWLRSGYPVAICTDDPLIFKTTLGKECEIVADYLTLSTHQQIALQDKTRTYAFSQPLLQYDP